jgi:hypothetical protein
MPMTSVVSDAWSVRMMAARAREPARERRYWDPIAQGRIAGDNVAAGTVAPQTVSILQSGQKGRCLTEKARANVKRAEEMSARNRSLLVLLMVEWE